MQFQTQCETYKRRREKTPRQRGRGSGDRDLPVTRRQEPGVSLKGFAVREPAAVVSAIAGTPAPVLGFAKNPALGGYHLFPLPRKVDGGDTGGLHHLGDGGEACLTGGHL